MKKTLITAICMTLSNVALAYTYTAPAVGAASSWSEILSDSSLVIGSKVTLEHSAGKLSVSPLEVCRNGSTLQLLSRTTEICLDTAPSRLGSVCTDREVVTPSAPVSSTQRVCKKYAPTRLGSVCADERSVLVDYSGEISVPVLKVTSTRGGSFSEVAFTKGYVIPSCN